MEQVPDPSNFVLASRFHFIKQIGNGTFGTLYAAKDSITDATVAMKLEPVTARYPQVIYESKVLKHMQGNLGFPIMYSSGTEAEYNYMSMQMLGPSLEDLFNYCSRKFSLKTVCMIALQAIKRLEQLHSNSYVHRDMKPDNFLIGSADSINTVFLIDFGLSKKYRNPETRQHIKLIQHRSLTGTARYASINAHLGIEQSRRDDLESLGYVLIYLLRGGLPWQNFQCKDRTKKYKKIMEQKMDTPYEVLLDGQPKEFIRFMEYCKKLDFEKKPDYKYCIRIFKDLMFKNGFDEDFQYDWNTIHQKQISTKKPKKKQSKQNPVEQSCKSKLNTVRSQDHDFDDNPQAADMHAVGTKKRKRKQTHQAKDRGKSIGGKKQKNGRSKSKVRNTDQEEEKKDETILIEDNQPFDLEGFRNEIGARGGGEYNPFIAQSSMQANAFSVMAFQQDDRSNVSPLIRPDKRNLGLQLMESEYSRSASLQPQQYLSHQYSSPQPSNNQLIAPSHLEPINEEDFQSSPNRRNMPPVVQGFLIEIPSIMVEELKNSNEQEEQKQQQHKKDPELLYPGLRFSVWTMDGLPDDEFDEFRVVSSRNQAQSAIGTDLANRLSVYKSSLLIK